MPKILVPESEALFKIPESLEAQACQRNFVHESLWPGQGQAGDVQLSFGWSPSQVVDRLIDGQCSGVLQWNQLWYLDDLEMAVRLSEDPDLLFVDPVAAILGEPGQTKVLISFKDSQKKEDHLQSILQALPLESKALQESVSAIFEEFQMNAVLDAPKKAIQEGRESAPYASKGPAQIGMGYDSDRLVMFCSDTYGSLDPWKFVGRMREVYLKGAGSVVNLSREKGGAGLGCVIMFEHCSTLMMAVRPEEKTVFAVQMPLTFSHRQRDALNKSLFIF